MLSMEDFITAVFCCVDDLLKEVTNGKPMRSRGFQPSLSDTEVITMEIVAEFQGIDTDKGIWQYFMASIYKQPYVPICRIVVPKTG
jgi:hypothetical protein